jgi:hypothetical protein
MDCVPVMLDGACMPVVGSPPCACAGDTSSVSFIPDPSIRSGSRCYFVGAHPSTAACPSDAHVARSGVLPMLYFRRPDASDTALVLMQILRVMGGERAVVALQAGAHAHADLAIGLVVVLLLAEVGGTVSVAQCLCSEGHGADAKAAIRNGDMAAAPPSASPLDAASRTRPTITPQSSVTL